MEASRKKIKTLWLPSWYPSKYEESTGVFIEKQAVAMAQFCDVALIYLTPSTEKDVEIDIKYSPFFSVTVYIPESRLKYFKFFYYLKYFFKAYGRLKKEWGKPNVIHLHVLSLKLIPVLFLKITHKAKVIISEHSNIYQMHLMEKKMLKDYFLRKIFFSMAQKVIVVTASLGESIKQLGLIKGYQVIPNVIDDGIFQYENKEPNRKKKFLHVSGLNAKKGIDDMILAFGKLLDIRTDFLLTIVGTDEETVEFYRAFAYKLGLTESNIAFERMLSSHEVAQRMQQADYFVMNSYFETFGIVAVEAQRCGLPVISYPTPGLIEVLLPKNTIFFEEHTPESILKALLLSFDKEFNRKAISQSMSDRYNATSVGKQIFNVYVDCLASE
jgi:glycosyltransferase involved in cell wall biosynthesis